MLSYNNKLISEFVEINKFVEEHAALCIAQSYFSGTVVNFHVDVKKGNIVIPFSNLSFSDVEKYLMHMGNNLIKRHFGYIDDADKTFYRDCFPFGLSEGELVCDENDEPKELIVPITHEVALNLNRLVISEIHRNVESRMLVNLKKEGKSQEKALEILKKVQLMPVDKSLPYGCRIRINDSSLVDDYIKNFEYLMYERHGQNRNLKFYKLSKDKTELSFINMDNSAFIDGVKKGMIKEIARDFRTPGKVESKIENFKNAIAGFIYESTEKVVCGFDIIKYTENDSDFFLVPLVKLDGQTRFLSNEDKIRFNKECERNGLGSNVLADTYIKDVGKRPTFLREGLIPLVPKIMKSSIGYNETSKRFEYAINLGNFYKSNGVIPQVANSGPSSLGVDSSVVGSKGSLSSSGSNNSGSSSSDSSRSVSPVPLAQLVPRNYSNSSLSQGSSGFASSPFGTSPVEDENSKSSYKKTCHKHFSTASVDTFGQSVALKIPSIEVTEPNEEKGAAGSSSAKPCKALSETKVEWCIDHPDAKEVEGEKTQGNQSGATDGDHVKKLKKKRSAVETLIGCITS
ncbi:hypothetical protein [Wolbachia endosymbiont of Folsomia candida]|uniref:hypothetical protein n=1 Tax=Wolbachia endosymbiont of Folsomia candida TaxID=169402 RepID=UPI000B304FFC|nr:hypothetical protein [Wolbachia endosymbiont of Folsomia candida]APR98386.1 hypothetical protein ASM33_03805 [Wolbachia endosymbiont of Folsomia candida]